jgi:hypothetical protein
MKILYQSVYSSFDIYDIIPNDEPSDWDYRRLSSTGQRRIGSLLLVGKIGESKHKDSSNDLRSTDTSDPSTLVDGKTSHDMRRAWTKSPTPYDVRVQDPMDQATHIIDLGVERNHCLQRWTFGSSENTPVIDESVLRVLRTGRNNAQKIWGFLPPGGETF